MGLFSKSFANRDKAKSNKTIVNNKIERKKRNLDTLLSEKTERVVETKTLEDTLPFQVMENFDEISAINIGNSPTESDKSKEGFIPEQNPALQEFVAALRKAKTNESDSLSDLEARNENSIIESSGVGTQESQDTMQSVTDITAEDSSELDSDEETLIDFSSLVVENSDNVEGIDVFTFHHSESVDLSQKLIMCRDKFINNLILNSESDIQINYVKDSIPNIILENGILQFSNYRVYVNSRLQCWDPICFEVKIPAGSTVEVETGTSLQIPQGYAAHFFLMDKEKYSMDKPDFIMLPSEAAKPIIVSMIAKEGAYLSKIGRIIACKLVPC